ncbi:hypothetical protein D3C71_793830 [compost metagenome]
MAKTVPHLPPAVPLEELDEHPVPDQKALEIDDGRIDVLRRRRGRRMGFVERRKRLGVSDPGAA